jgi:chemotaxis methyl-accepting protein methylase
MKSHIQFENGTLDGIVQRLSDDAGIDPSSLEPSRIMWTVERRCRNLGISNAQGYLAQLESSRAELDGLIDALVIQETRFFRDPQVFDQLRTWARENSTRCAGPLRILSGPCSTGQEAYSLAAIMHCAGIPYSAFSIDAFDISPSALAVARRGVYPAGALEHVSAELQSACGTLRNGHWEMGEDLRQRIRFEQRNLAHAGAIGNANYHLILCRNLFIYLHPRARAVLAAMLNQALLPGGRLVVGAGDRVAEINALFAPVKEGVGLTHRPSSKASTPGEVTPTSLLISRVARSGESPAKFVNTHAPVSADELYRRAADCLERGNARLAERRCRQALYLAPAYLPALEMLQQLWHLHPNPRIKRALTARIQRVRMESVQTNAMQRMPEGGGA